MSRPTILLFDLGGVLVRNAGLERLGALLPGSASELDVASKWLASPAVRAFEVGKLEPLQFARKMINEWNLTLSEDQFLSEFADWPQGLYPGAAELLSDLRGEFRLACLSNSNSVHWPRLKEFLQDFDFLLASHELGQVKPDADCFAAALHQLGVGPEAIVFFDDAAANVHGARALGIRAFRVDGPDEARATLVALGWTRAKNSP